ncbi:unnamed protein product, partial [Brassica rapa]
MICWKIYRRKHLICKEISRYNPSILCLQAIDRFDDLDGLLKNRGFRGVHKVFNIPNAYMFQDVYLSEAMTHFRTISN